MKKILVTALATLGCFGFSNSFAVDSTSKEIVPQAMQQSGIFVLATGTYNPGKNPPSSGLLFNVPFMCPKNFNPYAHISLVGAQPPTDEPTIAQTFTLCIQKIASVPAQFGPGSTNITYVSVGTPIPTFYFEGSNPRVWGVKGGSGTFSGQSYSINWTLYCYPKPLPNENDTRPPIPQPGC